MKRTGKIARLPHALREQLNQRLNDGEREIQRNADGERPAKIRRRVHVMTRMRMPGMRVPRRRALRPGLGVL